MLSLLLNTDDFINEHFAAYHMLHMHSLCYMNHAAWFMNMTHIEFLTDINWFHLWVPVKRFVDTFMWFRISTSNSFACSWSASSLYCPWRSSSKKLIGYWLSITIDLYSLDHIEGWRLEKLISHVKYDLTYLIKKLDLSRKFPLLTVTVWLPLL